MKARPSLILVCSLTVLVLSLGIGGAAHGRRPMKANWAAAGRTQERKAKPAASRAEHKNARSLAEGRRHLKKANAFAGANKWWSAVKEYTLAFEKLADPVVLFNRADCYRRLGENDRAIADYRAFLRGFPKAPNRVDIEAKIAALETLAGRTVPAPAAKEVPRAEAAASVEPARKEPARDEPPALEAAKTETRTEVAAGQTPPPLMAAPPTGAPPEPVLLSAPTTEAVVVAHPNKTKGRGYWWVWVLAGTVVAAGGATAFVVLRPQPAAVPPTDLGNYRF